MGFCDRVKAEHYPEIGRWRLLAPLIYAGKFGVISVPAGFYTDGASIPRGVWPIVGHPLREYLRSAIVHDFLYAKSSMPRIKADLIFRQAMASEEVAFWKRWTMWSAVRTCGWIAWRNYRKK